MKSTEFKVGILIIIALVVLFFGYRWLAETQFGQRKYIVKVLFPDAGGILVGDNVLVVGVKQGKVRGINLVGREVEIVFSLDKKVTLYSDAHFSIMDVAFVSGTKYLRVDPGTSGIPLDFTKPARGDATASLSMARLSEITVSLVEVLDLLQSKLLNEEMVSSVSESIKNLETFSSELTTVVQESGGSLKRGMRDFADASSKLKKTMNSKELELTLKRLDTISARLDTLTTYLISDETSVGKLLKEDHLYEDTRETLALMQALIADFKENPKKYINLKIF
jgi:phospholipid/cholesterol/gamma-HCH transport system substrate-binding protein